jgi:hypothetical protein
MSDPMKSLAHLVAGKAIERIKVLDDIEREGGLNHFEARMLKLAKMILEQDDGDASIAMLILCELAREVGFKAP